ncbi:MAG TPA: NADH-quinone oxidoreductase subunit J [Myxococcales bacterium]|jgi:NADH-quinone oxidoreductase subunit J
MTFVTYLLLGLVVASALWAVLTPTLIRGAIALALTSALITILMFQMDAALAGVFELSVCAGLITVVFVSTISLTRPKGEELAQERADKRRQAFLPLLGVVFWVGVLLWAGGYVLDVEPATPAAGAAALSVRDALWNVRRIDLLGQLLVIFVGVFGVVILFKEEKKKTAAEEAADQIRAITGSAAVVPQAEQKDEKKEAA